MAEGIACAWPHWITNVEENGLQPLAGVESRAGDTPMSRIALLSVSVVSFLFCLRTPMRNEPPQQGAPQLGQVNFPTSCAAEAQQSTEPGLALLLVSKETQGRDPRLGGLVGFRRAAFWAVDFEEQGAAWRRVF